jgi:hypothetical protein
MGLRASRFAGISGSFKVKCLNHTSEKSYLAPGYVTLMVVPNIKNKNAFDIYQPRVSRATLNKIQNYINELNTMHINAQVINPNYKEAKVETKVKFFDQYDETFYTTIRRRHQKVHIALGFYRL